LGGSGPTRKLRANGLKIIKIRVLLIGKVGLANPFPLPFFLIGDLLKAFLVF